MSARKLASLLLLLVLCGSACRNETERLLDRAYQALDEDDFQTASQLFREITIAFPDSPQSARAHYELAQIYHLRIRDVTAAEASLLEIISDYPNSPLVSSAHTLLGRIYERDLGQPEKAPAHYREVLQQPGLDDASRRAVLLSLGNCHYRLDQNDAAAESYRQVVELPYDPSTDAAYRRLASIARLRGNDEEALRLLEQLASRTDDPTKRYQAVLEQVEILIDLKRLSEATERLDGANEHFPPGIELDELQARLREQRDAQALEDEDAAEELEKRIQWGSGRRRAREPR